MHIGWFFHALLIPQIALMICLHSIICSCNLLLSNDIAVRHGEEYGKKFT